MNMKKGFVLLVLLNLVLLLNSFVSAQKIGMKINAGFGRSPVKFARTEAVSDGQGVLIEWETEFESRNLGFYIYRVTDSGKELVNSSLIPGTSLMARGNQTFGREYSFFDFKGDSSSAYYIESVGLNGQNSFSNQVSPKSIGDSAIRDFQKFSNIKRDFLSANPNIQKSEVNLPKDLQSEVDANAAQADINKQRWVAAQPGVKIGVKKEGIYRVARAELQAAGFDLNAPSALWQLYVNGVEQSIIVGNNGDYIEFYGKGIDTLDSDTQIYFLVVGTQNGKRMNAAFRRGIGSPVLSESFSQAYIFKERTIYASGIFNGETENFWGRVINNTNVIVPLNLSAVDFSAPSVSIDITIQGYSQSAHQIRITFNGVELGIITGSNTNSMTQRFDIQTSLLQEGTNNLQFAALNGSQDVSFFDTVKINFERRLVAEQNRLSFYTKNYRASYVGGFSSPNIRVFDITYPDSPSTISNLAVSQTGNTYQVYLPSNRGRVMYAVEDSGILKAVSIVPNAPSSLSTAAHSADLVIVSYKDWMTEANNWADYRRGQGLTVEVVNIEDLYDEFSFGVFSSESVKSFLQFAKNNWENPPNYALLLGDTTNDTRNYTGIGTSNFLPTKMVETIYMETGSDEALADFNNDGLAEIAIGRIPAQTPQDVIVALDKVKNFEPTVSQGFDRGALFASDLPIGYDFEGVNVRLANLLPATMPKVMINRSLSNAKAQLLSEMNRGRYIVNYSGHGSTIVWADSSFFNRVDAAQLTNVNNLSIFTMLTCLNGYFILPSDSMSESLLRNRNGGAVATWASTGLTTPDIQEIMAARFYSQFAAGNITRIGDLIKDAKTAINGGRDVRLSWALLGDPTLKVR